MSREADNMYTPDDSTDDYTAAMMEDNPIAGTHLDPRRQRYVRMSGLQQQGSDDAATASAGDGYDSPETSAGVGTGTVSASAASSSPAPSAGATAAMVAPTAAPTMASTPRGTTPPDDENDAADQFYRSMMGKTINDAPAMARIRGLQTKYNGLAAPRTLKQKLLSSLVEGAPIALGAAFGGLEGAGAAGEGVAQAQAVQHEHELQQRHEVLTQLESERGRMERQYERNLSLPMAYENMRQNRIYHRMMAGTAQQRANTGDRVADARQTSADATVTRARAAVLKAGFDPDTEDPIAEAGLPAQAQAGLAVSRSHKAALDAQTALTQARTSKIPFDIEMARQRAQQAGQTHQMQSRKFMADYYGVDPENDNQPIPGAPMDADNNVYGFKSSADLRPSGQSRSRADQGVAVAQAGRQLIGHITQRPDLVGHFSNILQSAFLGTPLANAEESEMASEIASYAALQPAMHGFRGQDALREFMKMIGGLPKDANALIGSIQGIGKTTGPIIAAGTPRLSKGSGLPPTGTTTAPPAKRRLPGSSGSGGGGGVVRWGRDAHGNPVPLTQPTR